uniref:hypothetical protein n=1 Tax=Escherichia coli TaxID=562 RepID=UPI001CDB0730|nr:hypothetical protein [Escherichia coli]
MPEGRIGTSFDGLSDPSSEIAYFDGREDERASRSLMSSGEGLNIVAFEEEELTVDETRHPGLSGMMTDYASVCLTVSLPLWRRTVPA